MSLILNPYSTVGARTFTFIGSCESTSSSLNFGSLSAGTIAANDLIVYVDLAVAASAGAPSAVTPSGFSNHINTSDVSHPDQRGMVSSKLATGSEGSVTGMNGSTQNNKVGLVFRPSTAFTTINALSTASQMTLNNPTLQTCDPSAETTAVILVGVAGIDGATAAFSTFSPAADGTVLNSDSDLAVGYKIYNTSPQSTQVDMNDLASPTPANWLASLYFTVS